MKIVAFYTIFVLLQNIHVFAQKVKLWLHLLDLISIVKIEPMFA